MPLVLVVMVILIFSAITGRRQEKKRRELLSSVKKYDKVVTIGGLIGTVVELRDDEVVLKVDDHSSTKIRFTRSSIQHVLRPPGETPAGKGDEKDAETGAKSESVGAKN
jgi:preprotein translocase subunit YajC